MPASGRWPKAQILYRTVSISVAFCHRANRTYEAPCVRCRTSRRLGRTREDQPQPLKLTTEPKHGQETLTSQAALGVHVSEDAHVVDEEAFVLDRRLEALLTVPGHVPDGDSSPS